MSVEDTPEYLIARIQKALATDDRTGELELDVRLAGGRIFLSGTVATDERCRAVEEVVREVAPGRDVVNELSVSPEEAMPGEGERLP
ncbi:MAG TPA: BON domain-containing protein [Actinomycetota bacterium]|nr:BON domain-containing protein [Actinomycetota bacterium]